MPTEMVTPKGGKCGGAERTTRSGKHLLHLQREDQVTTGLAGIAIKAKADPKCRFTSLAHILTPGFLKETWQQMNRRGASGVDGEPRPRTLHPTV